MSSRGIEGSTSLIRMREISRWQSYNLMLISHANLSNWCLPVLARAHGETLQTDRFKRTFPVVNVIDLAPAGARATSRSLCRGRKVRAAATTRFQAIFRRSHVVVSLSYEYIYCDCEYTAERA